MNFQISMVKLTSNKKKIVFSKAHHLCMCLIIIETSSSAFIILFTIWCGLCGNFMVLIWSLGLMRRL